MLFFPREKLVHKDGEGELDLWHGLSTVYFHAIMTSPLCQIIQTLTVRNGTRQKVVSSEFQQQVEMSQGELGCISIRHNRLKTIFIQRYVVKARCMGCH